MTNIDTALVERAKELLVTELRCDGAHLLAGVIENLNDGAILSNPPTSSAIRAIVKALQSTREKKLEDALRELLTAVTYSAPPVNMGGTESDPNLCYEARVPVEFVKIARAALSDGEREALPGGESGE